MAARNQRFTCTVVDAGRGRVLIPVPFDPDAVWGAKSRHPVGGTIDGRHVRGIVEAAGDGFGVILGPLWKRDCALAVGDTVTVDIEPEGPQREDLAPDLATALAAQPQAAAFFDALAQFYRRAYLRWIDGTRRRPEERARRIAEVVELLATGHKERPRG
jgi:hypothetical protein